LKLPHESEVREEIKEKLGPEFALASEILDTATK
jgi:hypothetical protein